MGVGVGMLDMIVSAIAPVAPYIASSMEYLWWH